MKIEFQVNGEAVNADITPTARLTTLLRDVLDLKGTKVGCDAGDCGACSVIVDGAICCSCLVAVGQLDGAKVTTIEGLSNTMTGVRLTDAFLRHGAAQCGICTPAMMVSAAVLLDQSTRLSRRDIEDALGGVLCRCTGYRKIVDAVLDANADNESSAPVDGQPRLHAEV
jgi:aldehyde oxidoreductase